jgi:hypothetical protein
MLRTTSDYFRQFTCFSAFLILNASLLELHAQDQAPTLPAGMAASAASGPMPEAGAKRSMVGPATPAPNAGATFRQRSTYRQSTILPKVTPTPPTSTGAIAAPVVSNPAGTSAICEWRRSGKPPI